MPAHTFTPPADTASRSTPLTRSAVEDVSGQAVTVYFSRDTVKKLEPTVCNAHGTGASGIDSVAGNASGTDAVIE